MSGRRIGAADVASICRTRFGIHHPPVKTACPPLCPNRVSSLFPESVAGFHPNRCVWIPAHTGSGLYRKWSGVTDPYDRPAPNATDVALAAETRRPAGRKRACHNLNVVPARAGFKQNLPLGKSLPPQRTGYFPDKSDVPVAAGADAGDSAYDPQPQTGTKPQGQFRNDVWRNPAVGPRRSRKWRLQPSGTLNPTRELIEISML